MSDVFEPILNDLLNRIPPDSLKEIKEMSEDDLICLHHGLGTYIRNTYGLWETPWIPVLVDGVDCAEDHPDAISQRIIEALHKKLNGPQQVELSHLIL